MIRLYIDAHFQPGACIPVPREELHYCRNVRGGRGEISLFNNHGQVACGRLEDVTFHIESVQDPPVPLYPVTIAVALPEATVARSIVAGLSELGMQGVVFFPGQRSQAAQRRLQDMSSLRRSAIEAARECGRGAPLSVRSGTWNEILSRGSGLFLDEAGGKSWGQDLYGEGGLYILVGCEGGWTTEEREELLQHDFQPVHLPTPVLKVHTAVIAAAVLSLNQGHGSRDASEEG